jgi:YD repeat-containing protein
MMRLRSLVLCIGFCLAGSGPWSAAAFAGEGSSGLLAENPLVTTGAQTLLGNEGVREALQAQRDNPEAAVARRESQTRYQHLDGGEAAQLTREAFPAMIDRSASGPPRLGAGQRIVRYEDSHIAQVEGAGGKHGVIESMEPMVMPSASGRWSAIDLGLSEAGGAFKSTNPLVGVSIPRRLADGVGISGTGVSVTPVDASGAPLGGAQGVVDGATVLYANTQAASDTVIKPTTFGFDLAAMLRSVASPQVLDYRMSIPSGARLVLDRRSDDVRVVKEGVAIATVTAPTARDAAGTSVAARMSVSGDVLSVSVDHRGSSLLYPIEVDPEVNAVTDEQVTGFSAPTNWLFATSKSESHEHSQPPFTSGCWKESCSLYSSATGSYKPPEWAALVYQTQGESHIEEVEYATEETNNEKDALESFIEVRSETGTREGFSSLSISKNATNSGKIGCCEVSKTHNHNFVFYEQAALNPEAGEKGEHFMDKLTSAKVHVWQEVKPTVKYDTTDEYLNIGGKNWINVLDGENKWIGPYSGAIGITAEETGMGVSKITNNQSYEQNLLAENKCAGVQCPQKATTNITYNNKMKNGRDELYTYGYNAAGGSTPIGSAKFAGTLNVDGENPYGLVLTGLPGSGVIDEGQFHLHVQATDGKAPTPSSGIKSLVLGFDGFTLLGGKAGSCTPGPCTVTGEWTINGEEMGAGKHTLTLVATDYAGNIEKKEYPITVHHANSLSVGAGSVDPITGAVQLSASDVSIGSGQGSLGVSRTFNSRHLTADEMGSLGPQWVLNISGAQEVEPGEGAVTMDTPDGKATWVSNGKGGFISPEGDENLVLEAEKIGEAVVAYVLKSSTAGTKVTYTQPNGPKSAWVISKSEGVLSKHNGEKKTFSWEEGPEFEGKVIERLKEMLAPTPAGVSCGTKVEELKAGCRALLFAYATTTSATGEGPTEWGEYKNQLKSISFEAYNSSSKAMEAKTVAEYSYDKQGRLRAEWDPRISPALKTTYGYDSEGHVVAVNQPGVEPYLLRYGTTANDPGSGRLLSVTRPPAVTQSEQKTASERPAPVNTASPTLSTTTPVIGTTLSVSSNGSWTNSPMAYSYAWQDCYTYEAKETCTAIPGAVNKSYTPQPRDAGYTLKGQVTAVNAGGATGATTAASSALASPAPSYLRKFGELGEGEKQFKGPAATAVDASGNVWVTDRGNNKVEQWSSTGTWLHTYGKKGSGTGTPQFVSPEGIAVNQSTGNVYVADKGNNRIEELKSNGEYVRTFGKVGSELGQLTSPEGVAVDSVGNVWVGDYGNNRVDEFTEAGEFIGSFGTEGSSNGQFKGPDGIAFSGENVYIVDSGNNRVQEFSTSGEFIRKFGTKGTSGGQFETPYGIGAEPVTGDLFVVDHGNNRVEEFNPAGTYVVSVGKKGTGNGEFTEPQSLAFNSAGDAYVADTGNNRVQELEPKYSTNNPLPEPPALSTSAVTTVDYNVPISGSGSPHEMTKSELEKWGQINDLPAEATAVFPPDEPMGWPAKDYTRATISYLDELGRVVDQAMPSGGIATSEFNQNNEVVRALSADNRAKALKEGAKSKEASLQLDTETTYSATGTEVVSALEPQHMVKLANGTEKLARRHVKYYYDEGSPEGEEYGLVTKTVEGAEYEGKESDIRTTKNSYSGQSALGWELRQPTSVTTDPSNAFHSSFEAAFGTKGSENGQLKKPTGVARASNGNLYVIDTGNNRVEEFNPAGEYVTKFGKEGAGNSEFKAPEGIAIGPNGNIYVADTGNNRVQEFKPEGTYVTQFGQTGTKEQKLRSPAGVAIAPGGNVYVVDDLPNLEEATPDVVREFTESGTYVRKFAEESESIACEFGNVKNARGIAVAPSGNVYVANTGSESFSYCNTVVEFTEKGEQLREFGSYGTGNGKFKELKGIGVGSNGNVYVADTGNNRVQEFSEGGKYLGQFGKVGSENGQLKSPAGLTVGSNGEVYVADTANNRIERWGGFSSGLNLVDTTVYDPETGKTLETRSAEAGEGEPAGSGGYAFKTMIGGEGIGNAQFEEPMGMAAAPNGNVYVVDHRHSRVEEFNAIGEYVTQFGKKGTGNGEFVEPETLAVDSSGNVYVADRKDNRVEKFSASGTYLTQWGKVGSGEKEFSTIKGIAAAPNGNVYVSDYGNHKVKVFSNEGTYLKQFGSEGAGNGQFSVGPGDLAVAPNGNVYVIDAGHDRVEEFSGEGEYLAQFGSESGSETIQFHQPWNIAITANGNVVVTDNGLKHVQVASASGANLGTFGTEGSGNGQFQSIYGVAVGSNGNVYVTDGNNDRFQIWTPTKRASDSQTIYYTAAANSAYPSCGEHPEWAELPCQSEPASQPGSGPELPIVVNKSYNFWDQPQIIEEKFGSITRTKKIVYDSAGRLIENEETSTNNTSLPKVTDEYNSSTGEMVKQSTTVEGKTKTIESVHNTLGELTEYTDADGSKSTYTYTIDAQVEEMAYEIKSTRYDQIYSYDPTTKELTKLLDSSAGTFTAGYDVEGNEMTSETYPNGMSATHTFDSVGGATAIEYEKTTHCTSGCVWFKETDVSSIHGETLLRSSTLASEAYAYDNAGRLIQVQETPAGKGCVTRNYTYNEDSNRTSLTTYQPAENGECATTSGTTESHTYDTADRMSDSGISYEAFGNRTKVPAADAGGHEITATFYVDGQTHSQTQNGETVTYNYDPSGRAREVISEGTTNSTVINHYPAPSEETISWTSEGAEKWTRNIPGIGGTLVATQQSGEAVVLQLQDLHGNIIATAALSETETKLLSTYNSTEFGVPVNGTPPKYSWLGAAGVKVETSGAAASGGTNYVPQLGQALQTQPVAPPGAPDGTYIAPYTSTLAPGAYAGLASAAAEALGREVARQKAAAELACVINPQTCEVDPEGIVTGAEAMRMASWLRAEARALTIKANDGVGEIPGKGQDAADSGVTGILEAGAAADERAADAYETCAGLAKRGRTEKKGRYVSYHATGVCYFDFRMSPAYGSWVMDWLEIEVCYSRPAYGDTQEWVCPHHGRWKFI